MTIARLQEALVARIQADMERLWRFETKSGGRRVPRVEAGWLPPKGSRLDAEGAPAEDPPDNPGSVTEDFPFVLVRPTSGTDGDDHARATFQIIVGVHSDDDAGHTDALIAIDLLRISLQERPIVDERFECVRPLTWALADDRSRPYWGAVLTTTWQIPRPVRVDGAV